jgi:hypothetical protein
LKQERALLPSLREASVGTDDAMPWEVIVDSRKDASDEARRGGINIAVGADKPDGDRAHPCDDARGARVETRSVGLKRTSRTGPAPSSSHDPGCTIPLS